MEPERPRVRKQENQKGELYKQGVISQWVKYIDMTANSEYFDKFSTEAHAWTSPKLVFMAEYRWVKEGYQLL